MTRNYNPDTQLYTDTYYVEHMVVHLLLTGVSRHTQFKTYLT